MNETKEIDDIIRSDRDYYDMVGLSSTDINRFCSSPSYYKKYAGKSDTSATILGNAIHWLLSRPEVFKHLYVPSPHKPEGKLGKYIETLASVWIGGLSYETAREIAYTSSEFQISIERVEKIINEDKKASEYLALLKNNRSKIILSMDDYNIAQKCLKSIERHKLGARFLEEARIGSHDNIEILVEKPISWVVDDSDGQPVMCKSKPDLTIIDHERKHVINVDWKSSSHKARDFHKTIEIWGYHRQQGFYNEAVKSFLWQNKYIKRKNGLYSSRYSSESYVVAVETETALNETQVYHLNEHQLDCSFKECRVAIEDIQWHDANNLWDYPRWYYEGDGSIDLTIYDEEGHKL